MRSNRSWMYAHKIIPAPKPVPAPAHRWRPGIKNWCAYPNCGCALAWTGAMPVPKTVCGNIPLGEGDPTIGMGI